MHLVLKGRQLAVEEDSNDDIVNNDTDNTESANNISECSDPNQIRSKN